MFWVLKDLLLGTSRTVQCSSLGMAGSKTLRNQGRWLHLADTTAWVLRRTRGLRGCYGVLALNHCFQTILNLDYFLSLGNKFLYKLNQCRHTYLKIVEIIRYTPTDDRLFAHFQNEIKIYFLPRVSKLFSAVNTDYIVRLESCIKISIARFWLSSFLAT